jgi:hypothetical protein
MYYYRLQNKLGFQTEKNRLASKRESFDVSQPFGPPRPVTGIALLCFFTLQASSVEVSSLYNNTYFYYWMKILWV